MRRPHTAIPLLVVALVLTSCGQSTVDASKAESFVRGVVADQIQARVASVVCPSDVNKEKGRRFTCSVTGTDGSKGVADVTQRDGGGLSVRAPFLHVREAEAVMADEIAKQAKVEGVTIKCPEIITVRRGARFACEAKAADKSRDVSARLTDGEGHFTYRLS